MLYCIKRQIDAIFEYLEDKPSDSEVHVIDLQLIAMKDEVIKKDRKLTIDCNEVNKTYHQSLLELRKIHEEQGMDVYGEETEESQSEYSYDEVSVDNPNAQFEVEFEEEEAPNTTLENENIETQIQSLVA